MSKLEELKSELDDVNDEIDSLFDERYRLEDQIEKLKMCEKLESVVLAALNLNYNKWCSSEFLDKNICWNDTDVVDPIDPGRVEKALVCCDILFDKGIIQRKFIETNFYHEAIYEYRLTDTETLDMFEVTA